MAVKKVGRRWSSVGDWVSGMRRCMRLVSALALLCSMGVVLFVGGQPGTVLAQAKEYHMDRYDSDIVVNSDGSLDITETLTYVFTSGSFHRGLRTWDLDRLEDVRVTGVSEVSNTRLTTYTEGAFDPDSSTTGVTG